MATPSQADFVRAARDRLALGDSTRLLTEAEQYLINLLQQGDASPIDIQSAFKLAQEGDPLFQTAPQGSPVGKTQVFGKHSIEDIQNLNRLNKQGLIEAQGLIDAENRASRRFMEQSMRQTIKPVRTVFKALGTPGLLLSALLADTAYDFLGDVSQAGDLSAGADVVLDAVTGKPITPKEKQAGDKSKLEGFGPGTGGLAGFLGTPEQELAFAIKAQLKHYEASDVGVDVTQATIANFHKAISLMGSEQDVNKKLAAAMAVQAIGSQLILLKMQEYTTQARASLGISDLEAQISSGMTADMRSPYNPRDGSHSRETQLLIDKKTNLQNNIPNLAKQYAQVDPAFAAPMAAAEAILKSLPITERLEMAAQRQQEKTAAIGTIDDAAAKNYAFMINMYSKINWNSPTEVAKAKYTFLLDKNFQDMYKDQRLSINEASTARTMFAFADQPVDKQRAFAIMSRLETEAINITDPEISETERLRRISKVDENLKLMKLVYSAPLTPNEQKRIDSALQTFIGGTKEKDMERKTMEVATREGMLQDYFMKRFAADVTQWRGLDLSNPMVQGSIASVKKKTGKGAVPLEAFVSEFLIQPGDESFAMRLKKLRAYILSSTAGAGDNSSIIPEISGEALYNRVAPSAARIWFNSILPGGI